MENTEKQDRPDTLEGLEQFHGTEQWYAWGAGMILPPLDEHLGISYPLSYTEGVKYVADKASAYWLIDSVLAYAVAIYVNKSVDASRKRLIDCKLEVKDNDSAVLTVSDGDYQPFSVEKIEYTDFPAKSVRIWVCNGVAMLPSEY